MPIPLALFLPAVVTSLSGVSFSGLMSAGTAAIAALLAAESVSDWLDSDSGWALLSDQLNARLSAAGVDLEFPPFNPLTEAGRAVVKSTIEGYAVQRVNAKAGTQFATLAGVTPDSFLVEAGSVLAKRINNETGASFASVWPVENLKSELHSEVLRQFDNRGRYAPGALFKPGVLDGVKAKIAAKHPELMQQVNPPIDGGMWGPPATEKIAQRRAAGRIRQQKYRRTHQQVWAPK